MKKFLLLAFLFPLFLKAQTYNIPWAQQQPEWVFPFWFENGDGQKDTVYLYYDPAINISAQPIIADSVWGNRFVCQDTSHFYVETWGYASPEPCAQGLKVFKASVYSFSFQIHHGQYPFKIKWDDSLLYDTILTNISVQPFPNILPKPIARIGGVMSHHYNPFIPGIAESFIIADTVGIPYPCASPPIFIFEDSMVFTGPVGTDVGSFLHMNYIALRPQGDGCSTGGINEPDEGKSLIKITNPIHDFLEISAATQKVRLEAFSLVGERLFTMDLSPFQSVTKLMTAFPNGMYLLKASSNTQSQTIKILKQ